jgi:hypothetical protein
MRYHEKFAVRVERAYQYPGAGYLDGGLRATGPFNTIYV